MGGNASAQGVVHRHRDAGPADDGSEVDQRPLDGRYRYSPHRCRMVREEATREVDGDPASRRQVTVGDRDLTAIE
jgi:hypothetical protein